MTSLQSITLTQSVSIHSPRRSEGRRPDAAATASTCSSSFNPLPPPKRGETFQKWEQEVAQCVSIHSPRRSEGRHPGTARLAGAIVVSIHSPRRSEGRLDPGATLRDFIGVSIHSPRRSEGRRATVENVENFTQWFQSTPPAEARGDCRPRKAGFNSSLWVAFRDTRLATCSHRSKESENMLLTDSLSTLSNESRSSRTFSPTSGSRLIPREFLAGPSSLLFHDARSGVTTLLQGCRSEDCPSSRR